MDYFYAAPRQPPAPPTINRLEREPAVPEVSLVENSFCVPTHISKELKNSFVPNNSNTMSKHVRFKSFNPEQNFLKENVSQPQTVKTVPDLNGKTFKQIYLANMPDRHLDLSIFDNSNDVTKVPEPLQIESHTSKQVFANYADFKQRRVCNLNVSPLNEGKKLRSIENISSELRHRNFTTNNSMSHNLFETQSPPKHTEMCTQTDSDKTCMEIANDEPTIRDLFKIIQQQNEQIMLLQRQVNNLKTSIRQPDVDSTPPFLKDVNNSPSKKNLFSFDVKATSFEFSFRPPQKFRKQNDFHEPKIQEIVECGNSLEPQNSLHLEGSLDVRDRESYVSDVPSIEINMDGYRSSDEEEEPQGNNIGLTFYKDLMEQVNNVLKNVQKQSDCQTRSDRKDLAGQTMRAVKQATLQHLKDIGVNLSPIQESSEVTGGTELNVENCNQSEISCAVQQLLMKYLPEDKLAKAVNKPVLYKENGFKAPNTEFSFATLQYMKKYNLISDTRKRQGMGKNVAKSSPKILDVTALKLQPKLL